ncbi:Dabb family protein [Advenella faeciporci]|nr:Dabb family protein [Advenella faeciporci]
MLEFNKNITQAEHKKIEKFCINIKNELTDVINMRFVKNVSGRAHGYTHAFVVEFVDENAHDNYQVAEAHVLLKKMINQLALNTVVLDYEL